MGILIYSALLTLALILASPWWLTRMIASGRYREGLAARLGSIPPTLRAAVQNKPVLWLHAVSVGEVLAAERTLRELQHALPGWTLVVSTTTAAGHKLARQRFDHVFFFPLDFAFAVRPYLRALQPELILLMESELWPRLLVEAERARVPVVVVNARISDRSFPRYLHLRALWRPLLAKVALFLAQGNESADRLRAIGAPPSRIQVTGNLKFDLFRGAPNPTVSRLRRLTRARKLLVAGSTLPGEEKLLLQAWPEILHQEPRTILILAPRHPQRFGEVAKLLAQAKLPSTSASRLADDAPEFADGFILLLDTLGDLAAVYELADVAFLGGSLVPRGGHNPLEAARFGVPVALGPSFQNFREIVEGMQQANAVRVTSPDNLIPDLIELLRDDKGMGERGRKFFKSQTGATTRTLDALLHLIAEMPERGA